MRRLVISGAAVAVLAFAGVANATTEPPDSTEAGADTDTTTSEETMASDTTTESGEGTAVGDTPPGGNVPATIFDEEGNPVATITVIGTQAGWTDYEEGEEPDEGREYVQVVVEVASELTEGTFGISVGDFVLQDEHGFITGAATIRSASQAEADEEIVDEADLANGESLELALTFQVESGVGAQSVFYRPDEDRLVDITEVE